MYLLRNNAQQRKAKQKTMLTQMQIQMLQVAAQHKQISQIFVVAAQMCDEDTVLYIAAHYNNDSHFTVEQQQAVREIAAILVQQAQAQQQVH